MSLAHGILSLIAKTFGGSYERSAKARIDPNDLTRVAIS
jgi:hypothetical protein